MKGRAIWALLLSAPVLLVNPIAKGDWQNTRWGMAEAQVAALIPQSEKVSEREGNLQNIGGTAPSLTAPYVAGDLTFRAFYYFGYSRPGLSLVRLVLLNGAQCSRLVREMKLRYGSPQSQTVSDVLASYHWLKESDAIDMTVAAPDSESALCSINYSPASGPNNKDL